MTRTYYRSERMERLLGEQDETHWRGFIMGLCWGVPIGVALAMAALGFAVFIVAPAVEIVTRFWL